MKEIYIAKAGKGLTERTDILRSSKIEFAKVIDHELVREFIFNGLNNMDREFFQHRVEEFLKGSIDYVSDTVNKKFIVRCEEQHNEMLQIYEMVRTIKEGK